MISTGPARGRTKKSCDIRHSAGWQARDVLRHPRGGVVDLTPVSDWIRRVTAAVIPTGTTLSICMRFRICMHVQSVHASGSR